VSLYRDNDEVRAAYAAKRGWFAIRTKDRMLGEDYCEMYEWCWDNFRVPHLHMISRFDYKLDEGCYHDTYLRGSEHLPGSAARKYGGGATFFVEDQRDATLFMMFWGRDGYDRQD